MNSKKLFSLLFVALFGLSSLPLARADEGMWTFNNVPRAEIKKRYGFDITDAWLKKVQLGSVRFNNGGSGSFVSPNGLVLTNHHVASDTLQKISSAEKDYVKDGFYAPTRDKEAKPPHLEPHALMSLQHVTDRVNAAVKPGTTGPELTAAR